MRSIIRCIIFFIGPAGLVTVYYFTGSWKISLIILLLLVGYLAWVLRFELGITRPETEKKTIEEMQRRQKKKHLKKTEDNPTLR